jgi:hypothetical protein
MSDPSSGNIRYNSGGVGTVTQISISETDALGNSLATAINSWDNSSSTIKGILEIKSNLNSDPTLNQFQITALTDNIGWVLLDVTPISGTLPSNGEECVVTFYRTGDKGDAGSSGSSGSSGTRGTSGTSGTSGSAGSSGTRGTSGTSGTSGTQGQVGGLMYNATTATGASAPASGEFHWTVTSSFSNITALLVHETDANGNSQIDFLNSIKAGDILLVRANDNVSSAANSGTLRVTSVTDNGTYRTFNVTPLSGIWDIAVFTGLCAIVPLSSGTSGSSGSSGGASTISNSTNATFFPVFVDANNASLTPETLNTDAGLNYNPSTEILSTTAFRSGNGGAAAPAYSFTAGTTTGIYSPGTNDLSIATNGNARINIDSTGDTGFGVATPTAVIHIKAGTATAGTAPLKLTTGTLLTTAEQGTIEYLDPKLYFTNSDGRLDVQLGLIARSTGNTTFTSNTTYANLTGLTLSIPAVGTYEIEVFVGLTANVAGGAKLLMAYTGTQGSTVTGSYLINDTTSTILASNVAASGSGFDPFEFALTAAINGFFRLTGTLTFSSSGTLSVQGAQNASSINTTTFLTGGFLKVTLIA